MKIKYVHEQDAQHYVVKDIIIFIWWVKITWFRETFELLFNTSSIQLVLVLFTPIQMVPPSSSDPFARLSIYLLFAIFAYDSRAFGRISLELVGNFSGVEIGHREHCDQFVWKSWKIKRKSG